MTRAPNIIPDVKILSFSADTSGWNAWYRDEDGSEWSAPIVGWAVVQAAPRHIGTGHIEVDEDVPLPYVTPMVCTVDGNVDPAADWRGPLLVRVTRPGEPMEQPTQQRTHESEQTPSEPTSCPHALEEA